MSNINNTASIANSLCPTDNFVPQSKMQKVQNTMTELGSQMASGAQALASANLNKQLSSGLKSLNHHIDAYVNSTVGQSSFPSLQKKTAIISKAMTIPLTRLSNGVLQGNKLLVGTSDLTSNKPTGLVGKFSQGVNGTLKAAVNITTAGILAAIAGAGIFGGLLFAGGAMAVAALQDTANTVKLASIAIFSVTKNLVVDNINKYKEYKLNKAIDKWEKLKELSEMRKYKDCSGNAPAASSTETDSDTNSSNSELSN